MKDLTQGSVAKHLLQMAAPIAIGMIVQTLYYLIDLYFVSKLGKSAIAGVSAAGNLTFLIIALTQILNVGCVALISQAVGKKQQAEANLVFNQSLLISLIAGILVIVFGYWFSNLYLSSISDDIATVQKGMDYMLWFMPNLALQFVLVAMGAGLRGTGIVKPTMIVMLLSLVVNIVLSPVLIAGWGTGYPMGVAGAGMASTIAALFAVVLMWFYFHKLEKYVSFQKKLFKPDLGICRRIIAIGFPSGGEFILMFIYMGVIYWAIKSFGPVAQAGFGLGSRIMQSIFVPALAIAFALPALIGQNYGAKISLRVKQSFKHAVVMISSIMALLSLVCILYPEVFLGIFTQEEGVIQVAALFLSIVAINYVPAGIVFTCSGMFQGIGNTWPSLISAASRIGLFAFPAIWMAGSPNFEIIQLWYLSVATVFIQAVISLLMVKRELRNKLVFES